MPRNTWAARDAEADDVRRKLGVEDALAELDGLTPSMLVVLGEKGVKTLDDLADLASDELLDILPDGAMSEEEANTVIMAARAHWFEGEEEVQADADTDGEAEAGEDGAEDRS